MAGRRKRARRFVLFRGVVAHRVPRGNREEKSVHLLAHEGLDERISVFDG